MPEESRAFVHGTSLWRDAWRRLLKNKLAVFGLVVVVIVTISSIVGPTLIKRFFGFTPDYIPSHDLKLTRSFPPFTGPDGEFSWLHPMGTDNAGRDQLARVLQGGQISLFVGVLSTLISLVIGVSYGAIAGYVGGRVDNLMMRIVDVLYSLPFIFFVIMLVVFFGRNFVLMFLAVGAVLWLDMARIVRGQALTIRRQEYVQAARALGVSSAGILWRHVVPNTLGPVAVYMTLLVPQVILLESFLSYLGLGVQEPLTSWGVLIAQGAKNIPSANWLLIFPSIFLTSTLFALNFLGDGLRDALDPKDR
jgi:oligopeptide transport system permease protein